MFLACFRKSLRSAFFTLAVASSIHAVAQNPETDSAVSGELVSKPLRISAYVDVYAGYLFSKPADGQIPYFVSSARHAELNINLAFIALDYQSDRIRGRLVPAFGTYMTSNYAAEPSGMRNLLEASAGFRIFKNKNLWIDAGILSSPYTNENAVSAQQLMYTRSLAPEFAPYYLSGLKLSAPLSSKTNLSLYLLNGWQQIYDQNKRKSVGTQLEFHPKTGHTITWNTYAGDERNALNPERRLRLFTDVYWVWNDDGPWKASACAYAGLQAEKRSPNVRSEDFWWQANFILSRDVTKTFSLAGRVEYFRDAQSVMIKPVPGPEGFTAGSSGLCMNIKTDEHLLLRLEGRRFFGVTGRIKSPMNYTDTWLCGNMSLLF
ncbi:MAG: hypothetical protein RLZZ370_834 [Bacteroidota bacterium]|jgi:hypothetical protein